MRPTLALAMLAAFAAACAPGTPGGPPPPASSGASGSAGASDAAAPAQALVTTLQVEPAGDSVRFTLQVTNPGPAPLALHFRSGQSYDFVVTDGAATVWRWSEDMMFTQALRSETLAPGETRRVAETRRPAASLRGRELTVLARLTSTPAAERSQRFRLP